MKIYGIKHYIYLCMRVHARVIGAFYIKSISISGREYFDKNRGVLMAATHPNSFLDSIVCHLHLKKPVWSLARGDAFKKGFVEFILTTVRMLPIFRLSEGKENMKKNDQTFEDCKFLFKHKQNVIIFSEGLCKNQTRLLPLKKGTARLAMDSWREGIDVSIVPTAITYDSFKAWGKVINLNFVEPIEASEFDLAAEDAKIVKTFNEKLANKIESKLDYEFHDNGFWANPFYYLGWLVNFPLYFFIQWLVTKKFGKTIFYDSIVYFVLYLLLPLYWLLLFIIFYWIF